MLNEAQHIPATGGIDMSMELAMFKGLVPVNDVYPPVTSADYDMSCAGA